MPTYMHQNTDSNRHLVYTCRGTNRTTCWGVT